MAKKILIADDEEDFVTLVTMRLESGGFEVVSACNGEEAVNKIKSERIDLILLDLMMPKMNGFDVCKMLKADAKYKQIPVIVLSALDKEKDKARALECGADGFIVKPFEPEEFFKIINEHLRA